MVQDECVTWVTRTPLYSYVKEAERKKRRARIFKGKDCSWGTASKALQGSVPHSPLLDDAFLREDGALPIARRKMSAGDVETPCASCSNSPRGSAP